MTTEIEFNFAPTPSPELARVQSATLLAALADGGWHTAKTLSPATGLSDRQLRSCAEHLGAELVTGNKGYRLVCCATCDEIRECAGRLRSQGQKMIERGIALQAASHKRLHNAPEDLAAKERREHREEAA